MLCELNKAKRGPMTEYGKRAVQRVLEELFHGTPAGGGTSVDFELKYYYICMKAF